MALFSFLTDNQLAIVGCVAAAGISILFLTLSFHLNPANRQKSQPAKSGMSGEAAPVHVPAARKAA
ncbi:hypothetical protein [Planctomicrobium sp. SH664]|uniref:hypothetical protein n=1 Tax=Planctomicrobium sp. SH664 TaxID=3448125 RepID=UPI003F5BBF69